MSESRINKEQKCFEKIHRIILTNFKRELDEFSKVVEPVIYNFLYFNEFSEREIREYLKNASDESLDKILDFEMNLIEALIAEVRLLRERIEEIEENYVRGDDDE